MEAILRSFRSIYVTNPLLRNPTSKYLWNASRFSSDVNNYECFKNYFVNRNPRNLERLRISRKPTGYHLDKPGKTFIHKVTLMYKPRYLVAKVIHYNGNTVIQASTNEWSISKHLYRCNDARAYMNLAYVLAERCLQSGLNEIYNGIACDSVKRKEFVRCLTECGVILTESPNYSPLTPWSLKVDKKPWEIQVE